MIHTPFTLCFVTASAVIFLLRYDAAARFEADAVFHIMIFASFIAIIYYFQMLFDADAFSERRFACLLLFRCFSPYAILLL